MDKIFIHALKTEAIIGIYDWERQVRQTVLIDVEISADIRKAALTDSIEDTLNYKRVAKRVLAFVEASQFHLVETLAEHLAMLILEEFGVGWVRITLEQARRGAQLPGRRRRAGARQRVPRWLADPRQRPAAPMTAGVSCSIARSAGGRSAPSPTRGAPSSSRLPRAAASRRRTSWCSRSRRRICAPTASTPASARSATSSSRLPSSASCRATSS